ncbi:hypothetical protein Pfo_001740, partial [Paulownia fortunei]
MEKKIFGGAVLCILLFIFAVDSAILAMHPRVYVLHQSQCLPRLVAQRIIAESNVLLHFLMINLLHIVTPKRPLAIVRIYATSSHLQLSIKNLFEIYIWCEYINLTYDIK